jgi:hypothetical protein
MKPLRALSDSISIEAVGATIKGWKDKTSPRRPEPVNDFETHLLRI